MAFASSRAVDVPVDARSSVILLEGLCAIADGAEIIKRVRRQSRNGSRYGGLML
jgi:hypothetical protein